MKRAILKIAPELLGMLCKQSEIHLTVENPLPDDAKCVNTYYDGRDMLLTYESEEFEDIPDGEQIPDIPAVIFTEVL